MTAIGADLVAVLVGHPILRRRTHHAQAPVVRLAFGPPRDADVDIQGHAIVLASVLSDTDDVPVGRDGNHIPGRIVEIRLVEICRAMIRIRRPMELPVPVQALPESAVLRQDLPGGLEVSKGKEPRVRSLLIQGKTLRRLPFIPGRRRLTAIAETRQHRRQNKTKKSHGNTIDRKSLQFTK